MSETLTLDEVATVEAANAELLAGLGERDDETAEDGRRIIGTVDRLCATIRHLERMLTEARGCDCWSVGRMSCQCANDE